MPPSAALLRKTRAFTAIVVLSNVSGNALLSVGLRHIGSLIGRPPLAYISALFNPWVASGVSLLILWMISQMTLLTWADLSFVLPVTSIGYVLTALVGRVFLHETVSWHRWAGVWFIVLGVTLVSRTHPGHRTSPASEENAARELVCS